MIHSTSSSKPRSRRKTLAVAGGSILTGLDGRKINARANYKNGRQLRYGSKTSKKKKRAGIYVKGHDGIVNREMDDLNTEVRENSRSGPSDCVLLFSSRSCQAAGQAFVCPI